MAMLLLAATARAQNLVPDATELQALKDLYTSTAGTAWTNKANWPTTWPATATSVQFGTWYGVKVENGDITELNLASNKLTGPLPASLNTLTQLKRINFSSNRINGTLPALGALVNLVYLDLSTNQITGLLPNLGTLTNLLELRLRYNIKLTAAPIPDWVGTLTKLTVLDLYYSARNGAIPASLGNLKDLVTLDLSYNTFTGSIPDQLTSLTKLATLNLTNCALSGSIPANIGNMAGLTTLYLPTNKLTGSIPTSIGNLSKLITVYMHGNLLSGSIPSTIGSLQNLTTLYLYNNKLTGSIPSSLGSCTKLLYVYLNNNQLSGSIPSSMGSLSNLLLLNLSVNKLTGPIPSSLGSLTKLMYLYLFNNQLSGSVPPQLAGMGSLLYLYLYGNQLSGTLPPELGQMTKLIYFVANNNQFTGNIPATYSGLGSVTMFYVNNNQLSGELPANLFTGMVKLQYLSLAFNSFSGALPESIGSSNKLTYLYVNSNKFTNLPAAALTLPVLTYVHAEDNEIKTLPNFSTHPNKARLTLLLKNNKLDFSQLEPIVGKGISKVDYSPQKSINDFLSVPFSLAGFTITPRNPGLSSTITWEKQINNVWTNVNAQNQDATQKTFKRTTPTAADAGTYRWRMTNSVVTGLTLQSEPITLINEGAVPDAVEYAALKDLFTSTNGANWTNKTNWPTTWPATATSAEFGTWFGVTVTNGDVTSIQLALNNLIGTIPISIGNLTELTSLELQGNQFSGSIPSSVGNLLKLTTLYLFKNALTGGIPSEIGNLINLTALHLGDNQLAGSIPSSLGNLTNIILFILSGNQLSGSIPSSLGNLVNVGYFHLTSNNLTGSIPPSLGNLAKVGYLWLDGNSLSGSIPDVFDNLISLLDLRISFNNLTGPLPSSLGKCVNLNNFSATGNQLSGSIPSTYSTLTNMAYFYVDSNQLSGEFPVLINNWTKLISLVLKNNNFSGAFPALTNCVNLVAIVISNNNFSGTFPLISSLIKLTGIDASNNKFTALPNDILTLPMLVSCSFAGNALTSIPDFTIQANKAYLTLNLSSNYLDFQQLEPLVGQGLKAFTYAPQQTISDINNAQAVQWTNLVNTSATGSLISKSGGPESAWNAGAFSVQSIPANNNGYIEFSVGELNPGQIGTYKMIGLSSADADAGYTTINYAIYTQPSENVIEIFENGVHKGGFGTYSITDRFRIERAGATIFYKKNGVVFYTSTTPSNTPLFGDCSFLKESYSLNGSFKDVIIGSSTLAYTSAQLLIPSRPATASTSIVWEKQQPNGSWQNVNNLNQDATQKTFVRNSPTGADAGLYRWTMTNSIATNLTLQSASIALTYEGSVPDALEYAALKDFYISTNGPYWANKTNWPTTWPATATSAEFGTWFGVTVDEGDVTGLNYYYVPIEGSLPASLDNLDGLKSLTIGYCLLTGPIPKAIGGMKSLESIVLLGNQLTGPIPDELGNLANLKQLFLYQNQLSGNIPTALTKCANLEYLSLQENQLTGSIPTELDVLQSLIYLNVSNNKLSGALPSFGNLTKLEKFMVGNNQLSGTIPASFQSLKALTLFSAYKNKLTGELPAFMGDWPMLNYIEIQDNLFSGPIPVSLGNLISLNYVNIRNNKFSSVPSSFLNLASGYIQLLLDNNEINSIPDFSKRPNPTGYGFLQLAVANNRLDFGQLESLVGVNNLSLTYKPQKTINDVSSMGFTNASLLIVPRNPGLNSTIIWEKQINNAWINVNASNQDATQRTFKRNSPTGADAGTYRWTMTNSVVTGLTLQSEPITVINEGAVPDAIEFAALKDLFTSTNGASWTNKTNWPTTWPASATSAVFGTWYGVKVVNNDITEIWMNTNNLEGAFPQSIFVLPSITHLSFRENKLTGQLPTIVPVATSLRYFDILGNQFTGSIPPTINNWAGLQVLNIWNNRFTGALPASIGQLQSLYFLCLGYNQLSGTLPEEFYDLSAVRALYLNDNQFEGSLSPSIEKMTSLTEFWGFRTGLSGVLPASLGNITSLRHLYLYSNSFTGEIPANWSKLTNLENFWIHFTQVSGTVPDWMSGWTKLITLAVGSTQMSGSIPVSFKSLTNLRELYLERLNLTGTIPNELQTLTKLALVDLKFNKLVGSVPTWLAAMPTMKTFILNDNNFNDVPDFSARADKATLTIRLENNQLDFSKLEQLKALAMPSLTISPQKLISDISTIGYTTSSLLIPARPTGQYSTVVWEKQQPDGSWLNVNSVNQDPTQKTFAKSSPAASDLGVYRWSMTNSLVTGMTLQSVPIKTFNTDEYNALMDFYFATNGDQWKNNTGWRDADPAVVQSAVGWYGVQTDASGRVTALDFDGVADFSYINSNDGYQVYAGNNLSGTIPPSIKKLAWLQILNLGGNNLTGSIPNEITELSNLVWLVAPFNQLTGSIPTNIGNLTKLDRIFLESNQLSGAIPPSMGSLTNLWALQLMDNQLTGSIPGELGNLKKVVYFHLYNNKLSGSIPPELGNMTSCANFGLQRNQLTGVIPPELSNMRNLRKLYVGENELTGSVPASLATVPNLRHIYLDKAKLSGPIPTAIGAIPGIQYIGVANNQFTFSDLIGLKQQLSTSGFNFTQLAANNIEFPIYQEADPLGVVKPLPVTPSFDYAPQDTVDIHRVIEVAYGSRSTLTATVDANTSPASEIQWFKYVDGVKDQLLTEDPSIYSYTTSPLAEGDDGKMYYYQITNPILPDLVLKSRFQSVRIPYENLLIPGSVGIGTTKLSGYRLSVNGKIRSLGAKVYLETQWSDFVFKPNYQLRSLKQLDQYIQANGHLPEMPSSAEVKKEGIELGKMDAKLLQKIEELTLYLIKMKKENEMLKKEVKELQSKFN